MNPVAPNIRGLRKVHKVECPIQSVINWRAAPAYKLVKFVSKFIQLLIPLPNAFNVKSSVHLIDDLLDIPYKEGLKLVLIWAICILTYPLMS
jgi:hypothetical protein